MSKYVYDAEFEAWWKATADDQYWAKSRCYEAWLAGRGKPVVAEPAPHPRLERAVRELDCRDWLVHPLVATPDGIQHRSNGAVVLAHLEKHLHYTELVAAAECALIEIRAELASHAHQDGGWRKCRDTLDAVLSKIKGSE